MPFYFQRQGSINELVITEWFSILVRRKARREQTRGWASFMSDQSAICKTKLNN